MASQINIASDVGSLLKLPTKVTKELVDKACLCIGSAISEAKHAGETDITISIGIGTLSVNLLDMQCKFIPGKNLKAAMRDMGTDKTNTILMGDQIFTDVLAAHGVGIPAILVPPINDKKDLLTRAKRLLEKPVLRKYERRKNK